jgi:hypothetical protein
LHLNRNGVLPERLCTAGHHHAERTADAVIGWNTWFGTTRRENGLQPVSLPAIQEKALAKGQYFNPNCFASPNAANRQGTTDRRVRLSGLTSVRPHYFGSDLAIFKAFKVTESQRFEVRISATNWLNHPNAEFGQNGNSDNSLTLLPVFDEGSSLNLPTSNASATGIPAAKLGYRWMQFAGKVLLLS